MQHETFHRETHAMHGSQCDVMQIWIWIFLNWPIGLTVLSHMWH